MLPLNFMARDKVGITSSASILAPIAIELAEVKATLAELISEVVTMDCDISACPIIL
jgi:hypothetical protein